MSQCCKDTYKQTISEVIQVIDDKKIVSIKHLKVILNFVIEQLNKEESKNE